MIGEPAYINFDMSEYLLGYLNHAKVCSYLHLYTVQQKTSLNKPMEFILHVVVMHRGWRSLFVGLYLSVILSVYCINYNRIQLTLTLRFWRQF